MLSVKNISKSYVDHKALDNISLDVRLSRTSAIRSPETYNMNEFLFFISMLYLTPFP